MGKKIVVVNAGPRMGWNTETLISEAAKGAESAGAEILRFDLFRLEKYAGCISCFGCKKEKYKGHCVCISGIDSGRNRCSVTKWRTRSAKQNQDCVAGLHIC